MSITSVPEQISQESQDFIVEQYKRLRQRDGSGVTKSAWRITVRQLESMIRLSEAMARMHCCDEVSPPQHLLRASAEPQLLWCQWASGNCN